MHSPCALHGGAAASSTRLPPRSSPSSALCVGTQQLTQARLGRGVACRAAVAVQLDQLGEELSSGEEEGGCVVVTKPVVIQPMQMFGGVRNFPHDRKVGVGGDL